MSALSIALAVPTWLILAFIAWRQRQARKAPHFDPKRHAFAVWVDWNGDAHIRADKALDNDLIGAQLIEIAAAYSSSQPEFKEVGPWLD